MTTKTNDPIYHASLVAFYETESISPATLRSYSWLFKHYAKWCAERGVLDVPGDRETVSMFLTDIAPGRQFSTLTLYVSAISYYHRKAGFSLNRQNLTPLLLGINRVYGRELKLAAPLRLHSLRHILSAIPETVQGARDRALLLVGFWGALRCSELIGLDLSRRSVDGTGSVEIVKNGAKIILFKSKTDQEGQHIEKFIIRGCNPCPIVALEHWLTISNIKRGAIFRRLFTGGHVSSERLHQSNISRILRSTCRSAAIMNGTSEFEADMLAKPLSGRSLRSGFVTSAVKANACAESIIAHAGWSSSRMIMRYARPSPDEPSNALELVMRKLEKIEK